ncbi:MAG: hypothetical protein MUO17_02210 [Dehalococcoidales bacterium]|nr:hypothetical protein [Dehalococcoidales bacterium]
MLVNDARFKKSNPETVAALMEFLRPNIHIAYTLDELVEALADRDVDVSADVLESLLGSLEYGGRIVSKEVDGVTHYQYRKVLGFMPMKKFK